MAGAWARLQIIIFEMWVKRRARHRNRIVLFFLSSERLNLWLDCDVKPESTMKKLFFLCLPLCSLTALHAQTKNFIDQPYIEVSGHADSLVTPDEIYISIQISEKDTKNKVSVDALENQMAGALKSLGIDVEKNLVVNDLTSNFKTYLLKSKDVLKSKKYVLKVKSAETAGKVFIKLEDLGISNTSIDHVALSDEEAIRTILLSEAVEQAHKRAAALSRPLAQRIGKAIQIVAIHTLNQPNLLRGRLSGLVVGYGSKKVHQEPAPDISFQKIKISAAVDVKFILGG
jgi:uncharacterized protein YggE